MKNASRKSAVGAGLAVAGLGLGMGLTACYPGTIESVSELDVVVTVHDTLADFGSLLLYAMPDTVIQVNDTAEGSVELPHDNDALIISTIEANLEALGYVRVHIPDNPADLPLDSVPDFVLLVTAIGVENTAYTWYPGWGYWGWWPGWGYYPPYGPGWGWGYPGYIGSTKYEQGTLFMDMIDPSDPMNDPDEPSVPVLWTGALRGLLAGGAAQGQSRIVNGINQAFTQSPYLGRN